MKKRRKNRSYGFLRLISYILAAAVLAAGVWYCKGLYDKREQQKVFTGDMEMQVLDVGQGLAALFSSDGSYMLYDGGDRDHSAYVVSYLKSLGIDKLDYIVASHYDADHISGLIGVICAIGADTVIAPGYQADTDTYTSFQNALSAKGITQTLPKTGDTYSLGSAKFTIVSLTEDMNKENAVENNSSIAVRVSNEGHAFLVTGDAQSEAEDHMCRGGEKLRADVYVAGHHGSASSSTDAFLNRVDPQTAVISCGKDNAYGHPADSTLSRLEKRGISVLRTDTDGAVTAVSKDGKLSVTAETEKKTETGGEELPDRAGVGTPDYVLNNRSMKFHRPDCEQAQKISEHNYGEYNGDRQTLIDMGYSPCGFCKP